MVLQGLAEVQEQVGQVVRQELVEVQVLQEHQVVQEQVVHQVVQVQVVRQENQELVGQAQQVLQHQRLILIILVLVIMVPLKMLRFQEPILFLIQILQIQVLDITQVRVFLR